MLMLNRVARILDPGSPFLELSSLVAQARTVTAVQGETSDQLNVGLALFQIALPADGAAAPLSDEND